MSEASALWYARVERAIRELRKVLADHERALSARATSPSELLTTEHQQDTRDAAATGIPEQRQAA